MSLYRFPANQYYVDQFLAGRTIDGLARGLHTTVKAAKKKGEIDEGITLKECRGIVEKAIYEFYMGKEDNP